MTDPSDQLMIRTEHCSTCYAHSGLVERVDSIKEDTAEIKDMVKELRKADSTMYAKIAALTATVAFIAGYLGINVGGII